MTILCLPSLLLLLLLLVMVALAFLAQGDGE